MKRTPNNRFYDGGPKFVLQCKFNYTIIIPFVQIVKVIISYCYVIDTAVLTFYFFFLAIGFMELSSHLITTQINSNQQGIKPMLLLLYRLTSVGGIDCFGLGTGPRELQPRQLS